MTFGTNFARSFLKDFEKNVESYNTMLYIYVYERTIKKLQSPKTAPTVLRVPIRKSLGQAAEKQHYNKY